MTSQRPAALVTGASRGIGADIAVGLAKKGYDIGLLARDIAALSEIKKHCEKEGANTLTLAVDVADKPALKTAFEKFIQHFGKLNAMILNQGIYKGGPFHEDIHDTWDELIDINLKGSMYLTRLALPYLMKPLPSRALIFISSIAGKMAFADAAAYCASKFGLVGFAHSIFDEVRESGLKVCVICPGLVNTAMGHLSGMDGKKMIQPHDMTQTVEYILDISPTACPVEITVRSQHAPDLTA